MRISSLLDHGQRQRSEKNFRGSGTGPGGSPSLRAAAQGKKARQARRRARYLCRASAVCKAWRREVTSPEFVRDYHCTDAPTLALLSDLGKQPPLAFNTELKRWVRVPAPFFHEDGSSGSSLVAQAKGLYVYSVSHFRESQDDPLEKTQLVVSNPLTGATKWLPPMLKHTSSSNAWDSSVLLDISEEGAAYRITCIDAQERCVEVYDSRSGSWTVFPAASVDSIEARACSGPRGGVVLFGNVYFLSWRLIYTTIVSFNLEHRKWRLVYDFGAAAQAQDWVSEYHLRSLVSCDDKLILVFVRKLECDRKGVVLQRKRKAAGEVLVYSLDMERNLLVHETSLPKRLASRMANNKSGYVYPFLGQGHHLCSCNPSDGSMVVYDFRTKKWDAWPASPIPPVPASGPSLQLVDLQFGLLPIT